MEEKHRDGAFSQYQARRRTEKEFPQGRPAVSPHHHETGVEQTDLLQNDTTVLLFISETVLLDFLGDQRLECLDVLPLLVLEVAPALL